MIERDNVADILEDEASAVISNWLSLVDAEPQIITVKLTSEERCAHLPNVLRDLVTRLRNPLPLGARARTSDAAHSHGCVRREQGYTPAMLVEESRMLQVSIFRTLQLNCDKLDFSVVMKDVMAIADEVDSQLAQTMGSFIFEANLDAQPIEA